MTISIPTQARTNARTNLLGAAFALGLATLLLGAAPADARNEFKNAFEHELGSIVAHHVAAIGHAVIAPVVVHHPVHYERPFVTRTHYRFYRHHGHHDRYRRHHDRSRHGYRGHGHRHHPGCGHAYGHSRVSVIDHHDRRDRGHRSESYDRRSRHDQRARYDY